MQAAERLFWVLVQFRWAVGLLLGGIRSAGVDTLAEKLRPPVISSLLETNLGMPYIYLIFLAATRRLTEQMTAREASVTMVERIAENNREHVREDL